MHLALALLASTSFVTMAGHAAESAVPTVSDGIGGVVTSSKGPEAGVWVIAETKDLPTRTIKIVVTDDQGRYMLPQLAKANYKVWVRGYGLVDSKPVDGAPGKNIDLTAIVAPNAAAAAQYYPANYWFSLLKVPAPSEFPGTGPEGNGIAPAIKTQQDWLAKIKDGCLLCHQLGEKATRELANNTPEGWMARISQARAPGDQAVGDHGGGYAASMTNGIAQYGKERGLKMYADWTQGIAKGEIPATAPPRPSGQERNVVLTLRDWGNGRFMHDLITTDRRDPTKNANGLIYGGASNSGYIEVFDPKTNTSTEIPIPGGDKPHDIDAVYPHNVMLDEKGRLWISDLGRAFLSGSQPTVDKADFCTNANNPFGKYYPMAGKTSRSLYVYDPATKKIDSMPTCFGLHHLYFGRDKDNTLFFSGDPNVIGWVKTKVWDQTHDASKSQGWCPMVLDTKEKGVTKVALGGKDDVAITPDRTQWNQPGQPADPKKDTRITGFSFLYGIDINPKDGTVWLAKWNPSVPSGIVRLDRGANPPETCRTEYFEPPKMPDGSYAAFGARGLSFDSKGVAWMSFGSGQMGSFDRSKCKVTSGPGATGQQCPEGWKFYDSPGPKFTGLNQGFAGADYHYQSWIDTHNTFGLGKDVPIMPGTNSDSMLALDQSTGKFITLRVPYPMGFYSRWVDGRIDNAKAGWKGRGLWATYSDIPVWHQEGGDDGHGPELVHFQLRPDPLAH